MNDVLLSSVPPTPARLVPWLTWLMVFALSGALALAGCDDTSRDGELDTVEGDSTAAPDATDDGTGADLGEDATSFPDQIILDTSEDTAFDTSRRDSVSLDATDEIELSTDELVLDAVTPSSGPSEGQNVVRLTGQGFTPSMDVFFGSAKSPGVAYLDATRVDVTVPGGDAGTVDVKVLNENGNSTLVDGYTWVDAIQIHDIDPARSPTTGGIPFTLTGVGFDGEVAVSIGGRSAIDVVVESGTVLSGIVPPGSLGPADVRVTSRAGSTLARGLVTYYEATRIDQIFPAAGPTTGGTQVRITGAGFEGPVTVRIGTRDAQLVSRSATELVVTAPAQSAGARNVVVTSDNGSAIVDDGYVYFEDTGAVAIFGIAPGAGPTTGGNEVVIAGSNLEDDNLVVTLGGQALTSVLEVSPTSLRGIAPPGALGLADVVVTHDGGTATGADLYEYLAPLALTSISPAEGPVAGGTLVTLVGEGFDSSTTVSFGPLRATNVTVISPTQLTALSPPGSGGAVDVVVRRGPLSATLDDGFFYTDSLAVYALVPRRGSQAGGTLVTLVGRGFAAGASVTFDGLPATDVTMLDPSTLQARTPPHDPGIVPVVVTQGSETATAAQTFTYFDPTSVYGGGWGDPIRGTVNVTVLEYRTGAPIAGAFVMLSTDTGTPYQGLTDVNGQITFSGIDVLGTQTITASKRDHSSATVETIDAENVTLFISNLEASSGNPPPPIAPGQISGTVSGAEKVALVNSPNKVRLSVVVTSQASPFSRNPDPGVENQVAGGNGPYRLTSRLGDVAVIALCGLYDLQTGEFEPRYMAMQRYLTVSEGSQHTVNLNCSIRLDQVMTFKLIDSPLAEDPDINIVLPYLNIGPEGVFGGYMYAIGTGDTIVTHNQAPLTGPLANMSYYVMGGAWTGGGSPYSLAQRDNLTDFSRTVELGPLLSLPQLIAPLPGGLVSQNYIEWTMDNPERVDMYVVNIVQPGFPETPIWDIYLPGSATSFALPAFLANSGAADAYHGLAAIDFDALKHVGPFRFDTFTLNDLALSSRQAWVYKRVSVRFP